MTQFKARVKVTKCHKHHNGVNLSTRRFIRDYEAGELRLPLRVTHTLVQPDGSTVTTTGPLKLTPTGNLSKAK